MKQRYLGGVALAALMAASAGLSAPAYAFDESFWSWDKEIVQREIIRKWTWDWHFSRGVTQIELEQLKDGDVTASAFYDGQHNPPTEGNGAVDGTLVIDATVGFDGTYEETTGDQEFSGDVSVGGDLSNGTGTASGQLNEGENTIQFTVDLDDVEVQVPSGDGGTGPLEAATELPSANVEATAVANAASIGSEVMTYLDISQQHSGNGDTGINGDGSVAASAIANVLNEAVNAEATAIGNQLSVTVAGTEPQVLSDYPDDGPFRVAPLPDGDPGEVTANTHILYPVATDLQLVANVQQTSNGDTSAISDVQQTLNSYAGFDGFTGVGDTAGRIANVTATAVGNVFSAQVGVGSLGIGDGTNGNGDQ